MSRKYGLASNPVGARFSFILLLRLRYASCRIGLVCALPRFPVRHSALGLLLLLPWVASDVFASCTPASPATGATVTCAGAASVLAPDYSAGADILTVNVQTDASIGVLLGIGGTALSLTGNDLTLNNAGTIDPSLLGVVGLLSSGTSIGNSAASTVAVNNASTGVMNGTSGLLGASINGVTGMALAVENGAGGISNIRNDGTIGGSAIAGVTLLSADIPVVAAYGGAQVNFVNTGTINGRVGFQASDTAGEGNTFANSGTINGGVSMGASSTNTFTAVSGSSVNQAGGVGISLDVLGLAGVALGFAPTGVVDGGADGDNTLVLQNVLPSEGEGSGTGGPVSTLPAATYINFQHLLVNSGTWNLQGAMASDDTTLNGGLVNFDDAGVFGTGAVVANGGAIAASTGGLTLANDFTLQAGGLTTAGSSDLTLSGVLSGVGGLTQSNTGTVTLTDASTYTGGTTVDAGTLALSGSGSLAATGAVNLEAGTALDLSAATVNQTIGDLTGSAGSQIVLGARTLTVGGAESTAFAGVVDGSGGLVKQGTGTLILTGVNTYSGGTTVSAGVLQGDTTSLQGDIVDDAALVFNQASAGTFTGNISGTGSLTKSGAGSLTLSGTNSYTGDTTISAGILQGDTDSLSGNIANGGVLVFDQSADGTFAGTVSGAGDLTKTGAATLTLAGISSYTGATRIDAGTLVLEAGSSIASSSGVSLAAGTTLDLSAAGVQTLDALDGGAGTIDLGANTLTLDGTGSSTFGGTLAGTGSLVMQGTGTQTLTGASTYTGGTTIDGGTLAIGTGGSLTVGGGITVNGGLLDLSAAGDQVVGDLAGTGGELRLGDGSILTVDSGNYNGILSGAGGLTKDSAGSLVLGGSNTYTGATQVLAGSLVIGGDATQTAASVDSDITVASSGTLGGYGTVDGDVNVLSGGHLAPGAPDGTFTVDGDLTLAQGSVLDVSFGAPGVDFSVPGASHSVQVNGNLTLDGATLNPIDVGSFGPGLYNLFDYTGTLTQSNGGISTPDGYAIQYLTGDQQINLINAQGIDLNIWNANGLASSTQMGGGSGTWSQANANWTDAAGDVTATRSPVDAFVIFGGAAGAVTVDDGVGGAEPVTTQGIQFASDGYVLSGDALGLVASSTGSLGEIRVGDGSAASADWTATINNPINGNDGLDKTGAGTLVLNGVNTYAGGTAISSGVLSVSSDANLGTTSGDIDFEGGILRVTGSSYTTTDRDITLGTTGGGFDIADAANTFALAQSLTGAGSLAKLGAGTLVLSGTNTYTGGTTISAGTLQGNTDSLQGDIVDNGVLVFDQATDSQFAGIVSGSGVLLKDGTGTLVLTADSTYQGDTVIADGTLQLGDGGVTGSVTGNITNDGTLAFDRSDDVGFAGAISGTGTLVQEGTGVLRLSGTNSYSGGTTIDAGTLEGDTTSLQGDIVNEAALIFDQDTNGVYSGRLSGSGTLTKRGIAVLSLQGRSTFNGEVSVAEGALVVGDASHTDALLGGNVTVQAAGTLGGYGTINGNVLNNGLVQPGGTDGSLTINGSFTQSAGGTLAVTTVAGGTAPLIVNGTASLGSSMLVITPSSDWQVDTLYPILSATGGVIGQFGSISSSLAFVAPQLAYATNGIEFQLARNQVALASAATTNNGRAVASAVDTLGDSSPVYDAVVTLDRPTAALAFQQLQGDIHASTRTAIMGNDRAVRNAINAHLSGTMEGINCMDTDDDQDVTARAYGNSREACDGKGVSAWTSIWGNWGSHDSNGNATKLSDNNSGLVVGADKILSSSVRLGAMVGTGNGTARSVTPNVSANHKDTYAGLYGDAYFGPFQLQAGAIYGWQRIRSHRFIDFSGFSGAAISRYHANTVQGYVDGSYAFEMGHTTLAPFLRVAYDHLSTDTIREQGTPAALEVDGQSSAVTTGTAGFRGKFQLDDEGDIDANVELGWQHAWGDVTPRDRMRFVTGGSTFTNDGVPVAKNVAAFSAGVGFRIAPKVTVHASYNGQFGSHDTDQGARLSLAWTF